MDCCGFLRPSSDGDSASRLPGGRRDSRRHGLHSPYPPVREPHLDASRVVPPCQDVTDDALHGAARWLVGLEHDVDASTGNHLSYCGHWRVPPSIHVVNVLVSKCVDHG